MTARHPGPTGELAAFVAGLRYEDLPDTVVRRARWAVADYLAVASAAAPAPLLDTLVDLAEAQGGRGQARVLGRSRRLAPMWAAMCNGTSAHHLELDDGHVEGHCHPGVSTLPALLADVDVADASGRELLTALAAGYEVAIRVGRAVSPDAQYARGFHIPGLVGTLAATAAMARLRQLSAKETEAALGNACLGPITPFLAFRSGAPVKDLYGGWPAAMGVLGVELAARGVDGPEGVLEGAMGWLDVVGTPGGAEEIVTGLGDRWTLEEAYVKPYAACSLSITSIDAALDLRAAGLDASEVARVDVATHVFADRLDETDPRTPQAAKFSIPWMVAAALRDGEVFLDQSGPGALEDPGMRRLAGRVRVREDAEASRRHLADERRRPATVLATLTDGTTRTATAEHPRGGPERPLGEPEFEARFHRLVGTVTDAAGSARLWEAAMTVDSHASVRELLAGSLPAPAPATR